MPSSLDQMADPAGTFGTKPKPGKQLPFDRSLASQVQQFPETAADVLVDALGPLGEAGMSVGDWMRTGQVPTQDIPGVAANVMLGVAAPGAEEAAPAEAAASRALGFWEHLGTKTPAQAKAPELMPGIHGSMNPFDELPFSFMGKEPHEFDAKDYEALGKRLGIEGLGPETPGQTYAYADKKGSFSIPGGTKGKFTYWDMLKMKADGIDASRIPIKLHIEIQKKLLRSHQAAEVTPERMFEGHTFGMTSPNNPLSPNQIAMSRLRPRSQTYLDQLAGMRPRLPSGELAEPGVKLPRAQRGPGGPSSTAVVRALGLQAAAEGGLGARGTTDYSRMADLAEMYRRNPEFFRVPPGDDPTTWKQYIERLTTGVPGLSMKTGSLGSVWQRPETASISAMDRHMLNEMEREKGSIFQDPAEQKAFEERAVDRWNKQRGNEDKQVKSYDQLRQAPGAEGFLGGMKLEQAGGGPEPKLTLKRTGPNPDVPAHVAGADWPGATPEKANLMGETYSHALDWNAASAQEHGLPLFGSQWMIWDRIRRRLEPHENMFPGLHKVPAMSREQLRLVNKEHTESGHRDYRKVGGAMTAEELEDRSTVMQLNPTKRRPNPARFGYFALPGAVGLSGLVDQWQKGK